MRIVNTGTAVRILTYRDGTQLAIPPAGGAVPNYVIRPNSDIDFLDDNAVSLWLFTSGILVLQNDDGSAYTGTALPAQPDAPAQQLRVYVNSKTRDLNDSNGVLIPAGGATAASLVTPSGVAAGSFPAAIFVGSDAGPLSFFNKKRSLGIFTTAAAANTTLSGGATKADDSTDPFTGNLPSSAFPANIGVCPVLTMGSGGAATAIPSSTAGSAQDLTGMNVYVRFKVKTGGVQGPGSVTLGVRLYTGGTVNSGSANYLSATVTNWNPTFEWQTIGFAVEDLVAAGTAQLTDITAITHAGVRVGGISTSTQILVGEIFYCPKQLTKGAIVIAFDDCRADTWTQAKYELDKRGFPGVLFPGAIASVLRPDTDQFQMSVSQVQKVNSFGWQVAGQAWDTESPTYTTDTAMAAMAQQRGFFRRLGVWGSKIGSYFSNYGPDKLEARAAFKANFPQGMRGFNIGADAGITAKAVLPETFPIADPNYIRALGVDLAANSLASLQAFAGYAAASKGLAIFVFHGVDSSNATQFAKFTGLLDYFDANRATMEVNVLDRFVQLGYASPM